MIEPAMARKLHPKVPLTDRLWSRVDKNGLSGCWIWQGYIMAGSGHGQVQRGRRGEGVVRTHIAAYELVVGPVPAGYVLHHKCKVSACVNPAHLQPLTRAEHQQLHAAERTHCYHGHPLDGKKSTGWRFCKTCKRERDVARYRTRVTR